MSIKSRYRNNSTVFDHWVIGEQIGSGSNGRTAVFRVRHRESAQEESALKVISIIEEDGQYYRFSDFRRQEYVKEMNRRTALALEEVKLLNTLRGHTNIVSYEDRITKPWDSADAFGVDLLIRMELLQDLRKKINSGVVFPESEIIKIGKDICNALMLCHRKNILHRDIKPENIFFNKYGAYKLGDFGVSRILKDCPGAKASTGIGTPEYVAPEQISGKYDYRVDIYSLGLVLYELSNGNHLPFATSSYVKEEDIQRRLAAKELPKPANASAELAKVILKACALKPEDRYQTAKEMAEALNGITPIQKKPAPAKPQRSESEKKNAPSYKTEPARPGKPDGQKTNGKSYETEPAKPKEHAKDGSVTPRPKRRFKKGAVLIVLCLIVGLINFNTLIAMVARPLGSYHYKHQNYEKAVEYYQLAADQNNADAQLWLGYCYDHGYGVTQDYEKAVEYYQLAADQGNASAQNNLGYCYYYGYGVAQDYGKAVEYFQMAADQGNVSAQNSLGNCYKNGYGVTQDYVKAVEYYQLASDQGDASAQNNLGYCYDYGYGVTQDYKKAVEYYQLAADQGDASAQNNLGYCYYYGNGVAQDYEKAVRYFQLAADQDNAYAQYSLGYCYEYGYGIQADTAKAILYYRKAAEQGLDDAQKAYDRLVP